MKQQMQKKKHKINDSQLPTTLTFKDALGYAQGLHYDDTYQFLFDKAASMEDVLEQLTFAPEDVARVNEFLYLAVPLAASKGATLTFSIDVRAGDKSLRLALAIETKLQSVNPAQQAMRTLIKVGAALLSAETAEQVGSPLLTDQMLEEIKGLYNHDDTETLQ